MIYDLGYNDCSSSVWFLAKVHIIFLWNKKKVVFKN